MSTRTSAMAAKDKLIKEQVDALKAAFDKFDKNDSGQIDSSELGTVLRNLGEDPSEEELTAMIKEVDKDGDGTIEFNEFLVMMAKQIDEEELRDAFSKFDKDGNGKISPAELKDALKRMGQKLSDEEVDNMIKAVDIDGDGMVQYKEFIKVMDRS